ncbi:hypothetical protein [Burkholderia stabilis]|nr:hypothetical protein [Burkholderia stabilis]HDR9489177.1 hypothetical protein [Burkholderia stabilis]HDR9522750.1 hypothetical protein [Burkholderia stabilis]HDR9530008.1 hypothetical protein [Burkholderia stabilis]HDR9535335.1 hypothetical protein [Burkholderia stabilis]HDR9544879.1 hypothetical protein [Burkholderia stabilis]
MRELDRFKVIQDVADDRLNGWSPGIVLLARARLVSQRRDQPINRQFKRW